MGLRVVFFWLVTLGMMPGVVAQQFVVTGVVTDQQSTQPLPGVSITVDGRETGVVTADDGRFSLTVPPGELLIVFDRAGYYQTIRQVKAEQQGSIDLGSVAMQARSDMLQDVSTITIDLSGDEGIGGQQGYQRILSASADVFESTAAYTFGPLRFRPRGYDQSYEAVMINGFLVNDPQRGNPLWSDWGGLNDVMRDVVVTGGPVATGRMFEPVGGLTRIRTDASQYRPGTRAVYSLSNRSYNNRLMLTHSTGMMQNGWAVTGSASRRWSQEGYSPGTFYDAWSLFFSAEKRFSEAHSLTFTALNAIFKRGVGGGSIQEVYDLAGTQYYNPYWGYQDGEVRNSRVRSSNKPLFTLAHKWNLSDATTIESTAGYWFGKSGYSALNWYDAPDPRPDYYRYLPSYYNDPADKERIAASWSDPLVSQLNWDHFYFTNRKNLALIENSDGIPGNSTSGMRSKYIIEDRRNDVRYLQFNTLINHTLSADASVAGGVMLNHSQGLNFNVVQDLLGGDFWLDIDQFAERDFPDDPEVFQNDLNNINRVVREGDTYSHSYISHLRKASAWAQLDWSPGRLRLYLQGSATTTTLWREGKMRKGLFPDNSFGDSEHLNFITGGVKAGGEYRITGRHSLHANAVLMTAPPLFSSSFLSPRTRNTTTPGIAPETIFSADLTYIAQMPVLSGRITGYYTRFYDQSSVSSFYHEDLRTFVNYSMTGVDKEHAGVELGAEWNITSALRISGVAAVGQYIWMNNPDITITRDNSNEIIRNDEVWVQYFRVGGTPHTALAASLNYNAPSYWWVGITGSYFDHIYLDFNPVTRTKDASGYYPDWSVMQQMPSGFMLDVFAGKSWYLGDYYVVFSLNASNLLNNRDHITGGFEQYRYDATRPHLFAPRVYYQFGFNYFANLSVSF